jgi:phosphoribosyl-dephospho-CoA transferase
MTINTPIQATESRATIIDQIIINIPAHCIAINMTVSQRIKCYEEIRNVSEANIIGLCSLIKYETWIDVFQENYMENKWYSFYSIFNYYFNLVPPKVRRNT